MDRRGAAGESDGCLLLEPSPVMADSSLSHSQVISNHADGPRAVQSLDIVIVGVGTTTSNLRHTQGLTAAAVSVGLC